MVGIVFGFIAIGIFALLSDWIELTLGIVMIFGSVLIAVIFWAWLGNNGWWLSVPLIALNLAWTGTGVYILRKPESILSKLNRRKTNDDAHE